MFEKKNSDFVRIFELTSKKYLRIAQSGGLEKRCKTVIGTASKILIGTTKNSANIGTSDCE